MNLTSKERDLCEKLGFEPLVGELLKSATGEALEQLHGMDDESDNWVPRDGLSSCVGKDSKMSVLDTLHEYLPHEYQAFHSTRNMMGDEEMVVLKTSDDLDIVRLKGTAAGNYELSNADIVAHLENWRSRCKLEIVGAGGDWINLHFLTLPDEIDDFAKEVYNFCPDIIDQHFGCFSEMAEAMEDEAREIPTPMRELLDGIDWNDESAGLEILKRSMKRDDIIPLWWD